MARRHKRFDGHRVGVAVDTDEQLVTAVDVMAGSARDADDALKLIDESEEAAGVEVEVALGDAACGGAETRREFIDANRTLIAKMPGLRENVPYFTKDRFQIDLAAKSCTCPARQVISRLIRQGSGAARRGARPSQQAFSFDAKVCAQCPLRSQCYRPKTRAGRTVLLHPEEELLAQARALQRSPAFGDFRRRRQVAEHRIAPLIQLGMRQTRYRGRTKTLFQALMAATVANLTLVAGRSALMGTRHTAQHMTTRLIGALLMACRGLHSAERGITPRARGTVQTTPATLSTVVRSGFSARFLGFAALDATGSQLVFRAYTGFPARLLSEASRRSAQLQ